MFLLELCINSHGSVIEERVGSIHTIHKCLYMHKHTYIHGYDPFWSLLTCILPLPVPLLPTPQTSKVSLLLFFFLLAGLGGQGFPLRDRDLNQMDSDGGDSDASLGAGHIIDSRAKRGQWARQFLLGLACHMQVTSAPHPLPWVLATP